MEIPWLMCVRGEDLRTIIVPRGAATAAVIASLRSDRYTLPRRNDAAGCRQVTDVGAKGGHFLIGGQPVKHPFLLTLDHTEKPPITKEASSVQTQPALTVNAIIPTTKPSRLMREPLH